MTAINVFRFTDGIMIWTDGAFYDADGVLCFNNDKVRPLPHLRAAVAVRGSGLIGPILANRLGSGFSTFDNMVAGLAETVAWAVVAQQHILELCSHGKAFQVIVAGWSEARGEPQTYRVESAAPDVVHREGPFVFTPGNAALDAQLTAEFTDPGQLSGMEGGVRVLEMQRALRIEQVEGHGEVCGVGGFAQLTVITRELIQTQIVKRWPDQVGQKMGETS